MNLAMKLLTILAPSSAAPVFTPASRTGLLRWYERGRSAMFQDSAGTTPVTVDGDPVGYWQDLSTNAQHALQTVAGDKPLYRATDVQLNGACIDFVSSDFLKWTTALNFTDFDLWALVTFGAVGAAARPVFGSSASDNNYAGIAATDKWSTNLNGAATVNVTKASGAWATATKYLINVTRSGSGFELYVNNVLEGTGSSAAAFNAIDQLGARGNKTSTIIGKMAAILMYSAVPSVAERSSTYNYLNNI